MIKRIIFFVQSPFNLRDYNRFGIQLLEQNGFKVEVWDVTELVYPQVSASYIPVAPFDYENRVTFCDKQELSVKLGSLSSDDFIMNMIAYNDKSLWLFRLLSKSPAEYAVFMANALPVLQQQKKGIIYYAKKFLKEPSFNWHKLVKLFFPNIPFSWFNIKPARIVLAGGERCLHYRYTTDKNTEVLWAHALDYDLYLKERNTPESNCNTAVFLDEYLPFHPDFIYCGTKSPFCADTYYPLLNKFFCLVEQRLGCKVVIAAHPRSNYEKHPDYFKGRDCIRGQTARLIKESRVVLAHHGAGLNFANLFNKPVIFITSDKFEGNCQGTFIKETAQWFGKKPIVIERDIDTIDWKLELTVDKNRYQDYRQSYIKTRYSPDLPFWQIVADRIKKGL